jgi:hypothetical protein
MGSLLLYILHCYSGPTHNHAHSYANRHAHLDTYSYAFCHPHVNPLAHPDTGRRNGHSCALQHRNTYHHPDLHRDPNSHSDLYNFEYRNVHRHLDSYSNFRNEYGD